MELSFALCLPREAPSVPLIRHLLHSTLARVGVTEACIEDMEVALSEACTNVLAHVAGTPNQYEVQVEIRDRLCKISVVDTGAGFDYEKALAGRSLASAEGGRGLHLMRALVDDLDFTTERSGTAVHFSKKLALRPESLLHQLDGAAG